MASLARRPRRYFGATMLLGALLLSAAASGDLSNGQIVATVEGTTFTVNISGSDVTITDATGNSVNVILTDVPGANGVVHVIDGVILPR